MPMMFACCAGDDGLEGKAEALPEELPVLFSSGAGDASVSTRATVPYMENDGRFVCRMYYQGNVGSEYFTNYTEAWLKVDNNYGNSVYRKKDFSEPTTDDNIDGFGFDRESQIFYWQNRKKHIFIAIADYNKLKTNDGTDNGTLNFKNSEEIEGKPMVFDLRRKDGMNSISDQQDIIMAHTEMSPAKATPEGNRVKLLFEHCFAKVQVNLKPLADGGLGKDLTWESIEKVELLGVADYAYLYNIDVNSSPYQTENVKTVAKPVVANDYPDQEDISDNNVKTEAKKVVANDYLDVDISANPYYTCIETFKAPEDAVTPGYVSTHEVITFGQVVAIRVTWHETDDEGNTTVTHVVTKKVEKDEERLLPSGQLHIYNLEMRRGTLAIINAEILPWTDGETYTTDGKITEEESGNTEENQQ